MNLPNCKKPCSGCPFRKDSLQGWLGNKRAKEIVESDTFTCHKTKNPNRLQCAGFMLVKKYESSFFSLAETLNHNLELSGQELVFESKEDFITHHSTHS